MKKIWYKLKRKWDDWRDDFYYSLGFIVINIPFILGFIFVCMILVYCANHDKRVTPVEEIEHHNIDSLNGVNGAIEEEIKNIDSIRNEVHEKVDGLSDDDAVKLFHELISRYK